MSIDVSGIKEGQKTMWTAGDYPEVARRIEAVGEYVAERAGAGPGVELLDVATGSGNVAIPAARAGREGHGPRPDAEAARGAARAGDRGGRRGRARRGRRRGAALRRRLLRPRHLLLRRDVRAAPARGGGRARPGRRPGGSIVVAAWTPEGMDGRMFRTSASYMPPPPPGSMPPVMWGAEEHVRGLFADSGAELSFERRTVTFEGESPESWVDYNERILGPAVMAKAALEPQGRYDELRAGARRPLQRGQRSGGRQLPRAGGVPADGRPHARLGEGHAAISSHSPGTPFSACAPR